MNSNAVDTHTAHVSRCCRGCGSTTRIGISERLELRAKRVRQRLEFLERLATLSERERQVVTLIGRGVMPQAIAEQLGLSVRTVSTFRFRALQKLELAGTAEIAVAMYNAGLLE